MSFFRTVRRLTLLPGLGLIAALPCGVGAFEQPEQSPYGLFNPLDMLSDQLLLVVLPLLGVLSIGLLLVVMSWNRRLKQEIAERLAVEKSLRDSQELLSTSQKIAHIGSWSWERGKREVTASDEACEIFGLPLGQIHGCHFFSQLHPDDLRQVKQKLRAILRGTQNDLWIEHRIMRRNGSERYVEEYGRVYRDDQGKVLYILGVVHDITERKQAERALLKEKHTLQMLLDNAPIGIWLQDYQGQLLFVNHVFCNAVGISEEQFLAVSHYACLYPPEVARNCMLSDAQALAADGPHVSYERIRFVDGKEHDLEIIKVRLSDEHHITTGLIGLSVDITARKQAEDKLQYKAYHDELTGLPNRHQLLKHLHQALALARRHKHYSALLFLDLDNFKIINDSLGHHIGDLLLRELGCRLVGQMREEDTAARLGGDEFVVILQEISDSKEAAIEQAQRSAEKIRAAISMPYLLDGQEHHVTPSIGIAMFPLENESPEDVLKYADAAMYRAKEEGRNAICFFLPSMQKAAEIRLTTQNALRNALEREEFELHFQPQVNNTGHLIGVEALVRWQHPTKGQISPVNFIPLAEETGLIILIGNWVLKAACLHLQHWQQLGLGDCFGRLSINVSPRQFQQADFAVQVEKLLKQYQLDPNLIELELTEQILVQDFQVVQEKIEHLRSLGVSFAIDDFGTGYSSLSYLKRLPLDRIKIDKSFVNDITTDVNDAVIVETIIEMAKHLGLEIIAEGVETLAQFQFLENKACLHYQGYFFSPPLSAAHFIRYMRLNQPTRQV